MPVLVDVVDLGHRLLPAHRAGVVDRHVAKVLERLLFFRREGAWLERLETGSTDRLLFVDLVRLRDRRRANRGRCLAVGSIAMADLPEVPLAPHCEVDRRVLHQLRHGVLVFDAEEIGRRLGLGRIRRLGLLGLRLHGFGLFRLRRFRFWRLGRLDRIRVDGLGWLRRCLRLGGLRWFDHGCGDHFPQAAERLLKILEDPLHGTPLLLQVGHFTVFLADRIELLFRVCQLGDGAAEKAERPIFVEHRSPPVGRSLRRL